MFRSARLHPRRHRAAGLDVVEGGDLALGFMAERQVHHAHRCRIGRVRHRQMNVALAVFVRKYGVLAQKAHRETIEQRFACLDRRGRNARKLVKRGDGVGESGGLGRGQFKQLPVILLGAAGRMAHQPGWQQPLFDEVVLETLLNRNGHHTLPASLTDLLSKIAHRPARRHGATRRARFDTINSPPVMN